jgi:hypothetical protein
MLDGQILATIGNRCNPTQQTFIQACRGKVESSCWAPAYWPDETTGDADGKQL